jgi:hypothetical protein
MPKTYNIKRKLTFSIIICIKLHTLSPLSLSRDIEWRRLEDWLGVILVYHTLLFFLPLFSFAAEELLSDFSLEVRLSLMQFFVFPFLFVDKSKFFLFLFVDIYILRGFERVTLLGIVSAH